MKTLFDVALLGRWSPRTHCYHHRGVRRAVHTLLLIAERLWRLAEAEDAGKSSSLAADAAMEEDVAALSMLNVPISIEIWLHILGFIQRCHYAVPLGEPSENVVIYGPRLV